MSEERATRPQRTITPVRLLAVTAFGAFVACAVLGYRAYSQHAAEQRWKNDVRRLGARVIVAGYDNTSFGIGRVPILGELIGHRRQLEVFLDNPATADAVLDKATECPQLGRVWIDMTVFERSMADRVQQRLPGMHVIFYTPANASQPSSGRGG